MRDDLLRGRQPLRSAPNNLQVIIHEPHQSEPDGGEDHQPHVPIRDICPEQGREDDRKQDQEPAHRRRAGLGQMAARTIVPNLLPQPHLLQLLDQDGGQHEGYEKRRHRRVDDAETQIPEDVQKGELGVERIEPKIQHLSAPCPRTNAQC